MLLTMTLQTSQLCSVTMRRAGVGIY